MGARGPRSVKAVASLGGGAQVGSASDWVRGFPIGPRAYGGRGKRERVGAVDGPRWAR
jgi:hypothetical protein